MATVLVTMVAGKPGPGHKHAVIKCAGTKITLPITSPAVDHAGFARDWQQAPRPDDRPLLGSAGQQLHTMKLPVTVARRDGSAVEDILVNLINMSRDTDHVVTLHQYGFLEAGPWRLTDVAISSQMRKLGTNQITRASVTLTLTEAVADPSPQATKKKRKHGGKDTGKSSGKSSRPKTYTVKPGDTLSAIAARFYGDANDWQKIAKANGIRNPRKLRIGQVLKLP